MSEYEDEPERDRRCPLDVPHVDAVEVEAPEGMRMCRALRVMVVAEVLA